LITKIPTGTTQPLIWNFLGSHIPFFPVHSSDGRAVPLHTKTIRISQTTRGLR